MVQELLGTRVGAKYSSPREPWRKDNCDRPGCQICYQKDGEPGQCWTRFCTYQSNCSSCEEIGIKTCYIGETTNLYRRTRQHFEGLRDRRQANVLHQHVSQHHPLQHLGRNDFTLQVTGRQRTAVGRQAEEGVRIMQEMANKDLTNSTKVGGQKYTKLVLLNSKREFHQPLGGIRVQTKYIE